MNGRTREFPLGSQADVFKQRPECIDGSFRFFPLGLQYGFLNGYWEFGLSLVGTDLRRESLDSPLFPSVVPSLYGSFCDVDSVGIGNMVGASGYFSDQTFDLPTLQLLPTGQRTQDRKAKQGNRMNISSHFRTPFCERLTEYPG